MTLFRLRSAALCAVATAGLLSSPCYAADVAPTLRGARAVLSDAGNDLRPSGENTRENALANVVTAGRALRKEQAALSAEQAADRWLALWDQAAEATGPYEGLYRYSGPGAVLIGTIPRPEAWPILVQRTAGLSIGRIRPPALLMPSAQERYVKTQMLNRSKRLVALILSEQWDAAVALFKDQPEAAKSIKHLRAERTPRDFLTALPDVLAEGERSPASIIVPDIQPRIGETATAELAAKLLADKRVQCLTVHGAATSATFRKTALSLLPTLHRAPWDLCASPEGAEMYDAVAKQFGEAEAPIGEPNRVEFYSYANWDRALGYRIWFALRRNQADEAIRLLGKGKHPEQEAPSQLGELMTRGIDPSFAYSVFRQAVDTTHAPWMIQMLVRLAPSAGKVDDAMNLLTKSMAAVSQEERDKLRLFETQLRFAAGETEKGIALLVEDMNTSSATSTVSHRAETASKLIRVGLALERSDLVEQGVDFLVKLPPPPTNSPANSDIFQSLLSAGSRLTSARHFLDAEAVLGLALKYRDNSRQESVLENLVKLYDQAKRSEDVLFLLRSAPGWEHDDLAEYSYRSLWLPAARALVATGDRARADAIVRAVFTQETTEDGAYELLLELHGNNAMAEIDRMIAEDRWEERPLIWKAELLRRQKKLGEAERTVRQALAVDPTDGDQKDDRRVFGYALLGDILTEEGKKDDAAFFRHVVQSVRVAQRGDELKEEGLFEDARKKYEEAETAFADAYCVQWRLAERLYSEGKIQEAEKHYEIAFERMPEQFGRMAQLCFGCERVFGNSSSMGAADRVLTRLTTQPNVRPQALLILARLRIEQDRLAEAWDLLQRDVKIDPDHLDAWKELDQLFEKVDAPITAQKEVVARLLTLDPAGKHACLDTRHAYLLGPQALWPLLQEAISQKHAQSELLAFDAARKQHEELAAKNPEEGRRSSRDVLGEFQSSYGYQWALAEYISGVLEINTSGY